MLNIFKKKKLKSYQAIGGNDVIFTPIYHNDAISIVHDACVICVDGQKERTAAEKEEFVAGKVRIGHESILEHTNYIVKLEFESNDSYYINALYEMIDCLKFLNVKTKVYELDDGYKKYTVLIGGSVRGYKHIVRTIYNYKNPIYLALLDYIKLEIPSCFFSDLIKEGIFNKTDFMDVNTKENGYPNTDYRSYINKDYQSVGVVLSVDPIEDIYKKLDGEFSYYELMDFCVANTISINVSRSCSHQEVRHRAAGITQLSQRYVNMGDSIELNNLIDEASINIGEFFNLDYMTLNTHNFMKFSKFYYNKLIEDGWKKEDARFFLPNLTSTTLYMTFTFRGLFKAIDLREGKGAQEEIKQLFKCIETGFIHKLNIRNLEGYTMHDYILPRYDFESLENSKNAE